MIFNFTLEQYKFFTQDETIHSQYDNATRDSSPHQ